MRGIVVAILVAGCGRIHFGTRGDDTGVGDGGATDGRSCDWDGGNRFENVNSIDNDWEPTLSPDGLTMVFTRVPFMGTEHLFSTHRATPNSNFPAATQAAVLGGGAVVSDTGAAFTPDGSQLYFVSNRLVPTMYHLYASTFDGTLFGAPVEVPELASVTMFGPTVSHSGLELFYSTQSMTSEIVRATRATISSPWVPQGLVTEINSGLGDAFPGLSLDDLTIFFESVRDNAGGNIYSATRPAVGATFGPVTKVDALDTGSESGDPEIQPDGAMLFAATRPGNVGLQDIFLASLVCL